MDQKEARSGQTSTCVQVLIFDGQSNFRRIFDILPFLKDVVGKCWICVIFEILPKMTSARKAKDYWYNAINLGVGSFWPNLTSQNKIMSEIQFRRIFERIQYQQNFEISKILHTPPICGSHFVDLKMLDFGFWHIIFKFWVDLRYDIA